MANWPFWNRKPELRVAVKLKSVSVQCRTERTFSRWNALMGLVFRIALGEPIHWLDAGAGKAPPHLRIWLSTHAGTLIGQPAGRRNRGLKTAVD